MSLITYYKSLGKLRSIVAETLCFLSILHTSGNIVAETKLTSRQAKMLPNNSKIFLAEAMFPRMSTCFQMFPEQETLFYQLGM